MRSKVGVIGRTTIVVFSLLLVTEAPAWGSQVRTASKSASATSGAGLLLAMSAGVVILGIGGFTALTWSRRKRAPQQCSLEREALEVAEQAVRYWEGALLHLHQHPQVREDPPGSVETSRESHESLLAKAKSGHERAVKERDERQLDLIRCMASGAAKAPTRDSAVAPLEPLRFIGERPEPPSNPAQ